MIIAEFTDHSGIIKAGAGYQDISTYRVEDLRDVLSKFADGTEVRLASLPHQQGGNAILMQPRNSKDPNWVFVCPMIGGIRYLFRGGMNEVPQ